MEKKRLQFTYTMINDNGTNVSNRRFQTDCILLPVETSNSRKIKDSTDSYVQRQNTNIQRKERSESQPQHIGL